MATPATASPDKLVRRQAQAKEDDHNGGAVPILLLFAGAGALGLYELLKAKPAPTLTCPTGYTLTNGSCVANTPPGKTLPAGFPANYCQLSQLDQQIGIVWYRLLGRFPDNGDYSAEEAAYNGHGPLAGESGLNAVAQYITNAPQGEFDMDVAAEAANPSNPPGWWGSGTYEDHLIAVAFQRFLQRWPNGPGDSTWQSWVNIFSGQGLPALCRAAFAPSAEFSQGVPMQAASYC